MASTLKSCGTNVVGITLAYVGLVWLRALEQHRNNRWQLSRSDAQNDVGPTPFVNTRPTKLPTKCQSWPYIWLLSGTRLGQWCSLCSNSSFSIIFFWIYWGCSLLVWVLSYVKEGNGSHLWYTEHRGLLWRHINQKLIIPNYDA